MAAEIVSTIETIVKLGLEIKARIELFKEAAEGFTVLITSLSLLRPLFENKQTGELFDGQQEELAHILNLFKSIAESCANCAKRLDISAPGFNDATKKDKDRVYHRYGAHNIRKKTKQAWAFLWIHDTVEEIEYKSRILQQVCSTVTARLTIQNEQRRVVAKAESSSITQTTVPLEVNFTTTFAGIGEMIGEVMKECRELRQRLREAILLPDASYAQAYEARNPEGVSFWRDRFQKGELNASALRYEKLYVSWARFLHIVESSLVLAETPTSTFSQGDVDVHREQGSQWFIDPTGTRDLSSIRPLWLPALRYALDPLHKGYVKPEDYFALLRGSSLTQAIKRLVCKSCGYGTLVECERASGDLALPARIENPHDHVGWISAQIVAVPTSHELGIIPEEEISGKPSDFVFTNFSETNRDVQVHVRYLQTGQIERKSLAKQIRPMAAIAIGAELSIRYDLDSGGHAWSSDLKISQFKASSGGRYILTTGEGPYTTVFSTTPPDGSFDDTLIDDDISDLAIPELSFTFLGPSKTFRHSPQVGEKIQVKYFEDWYDSRVTVVDGDDIEYVSWNNSHDLPKADAVEDRGDEGEDKEYETYYFPNDQLTELGKGNRRPWRPWRKDIRHCYVRPYRRFHLGDLVEAPVMYPDFRYHYHVVDHSQLYLPARIVAVKGDQYTVEFSPESVAYEWWPGRIAKGEDIELIPGSENKIKNPFDGDRVTLSMDLVRPYIAGPRPVLGLQSFKPEGWDTFQGVHFRKLENLMEQSLWGSEHASMTMEI